MINNLNENNFFLNLNQNMRNDYSFECLTEIDELKKIIYKGHKKKVKFNLLLKNNGNKAWPEG